MSNESWSHNTQLDKLDFKTKTVTKDKGHYLIIQGIVQHENITFVKIYSANIGVTKYIKELIQKNKVIHW